MQTDRQPELTRGLGLAAAIAIVIGTVIGSGIFLVPKTMVRATGSAEMVFMVWIFGGLLSLAGALTYAELAAAMPEAGGEYVYLSAAYGPFWGFVYGWTQTWVAKPASIATLATGFYYYLANFFPALDHVVTTLPGNLAPNGGPLEIRSGQLLAMALVMFLAVINYFGVKIGGSVQVAVTAIKVGAILAIVVIGIGFGAGDAAHFRQAIPAAPGGMSGFFVALVAALWAYDGWNNVSMVSSEIKNPSRNLPIALIAGTAAVIAIYLLVNLAYFYVLTPAEVASSDRVAAEMMRHVFGPRGAGAVSLAAVISIFAALNGSLLSGARVPYAMGRDGLFFRATGRVHPLYRTPGVAIIGLAAWGALMILTGRFDDLFTLVIFSSWILYGMTAASVIVLRRRRPEMARPYRVGGYPLVPLAFVIVACVLLGSTFLESPRQSLRGLALIVAGIPFYFYWKRRISGAGAPPRD